MDFKPPLGILGISPKKLQKPPALPIDWETETAYSVLSVSEDSNDINPCNYDFRKISPKILREFFKTEERFEKFCENHDLIIGFNISPWSVNKRKRDEFDPHSDREQQKRKTSPEKGEIQRALDGVTNHIFSLLNIPNTTVEFSAKVNRNNGPFKRPLGRWARGKKFSYRYGTYI
jgi:hypothetical protein